MAEQEAKTTETIATGDGKIRVIIADSEPIFRVGVRKIFALEDDIRVVAQAENVEQALLAAGKFGCDIMLFESALTPTPADAVATMLAAVPTLRVIVVVPELVEEETVEFLRRGVRGIVTRSIGPDLLIRCVRKIHEGETWLDNRGVNWVLEAYRSQASQLTMPRNRVKLSSKEIAIIAGVTQGLRNKDIAAEVGTTEQVVKNYLRKIYDKLGVSDRLELALYCMHHRLLEGQRRADGAIVTEAETRPRATAAGAASGNEHNGAARK